MRRFNAMMAATLFVALPAIAGGPPIADGILDGAYGPARVLQNTPTGFGNSNLGFPDFANGSELNGGYGIIQGGNLYLMLTGNLESNFNKLDIFIDSVPGGQNQLRGDNRDVDFNGLNRMGNDGSGNGMRFDVDFSPDYWISTTGGNSPYESYLNSAQLLTGGGDGTEGGFQGGGPGRVVNGANGIVYAIDNSNTGGVDGGAVNDPSLVTTGMELIIPLSLLGNPVGDIKIAAMINGGGHDFLSNQVLGGIGGGGNLGEPRSVDFSQIPGNQYFIVPEPASLAALALLGLLIRRR